MKIDKVTPANKCRKCGTLLNKYRCPTCVKAYNATYHAANREKHNASSAAWYKENIDRAKKNRAAWNKANIEKRRADAAAWYRNNLERVKAYKISYRIANLENSRARSLAWQRANPEARKLIISNNRAKRKAVIGKLSKGLADRLFKLQRGKCACCGDSLGKDYHMDHIMPLTLGGLNTDENIQLLKAECNLKKNAKHPVDFMQSQGFLL